MGKINTWIESVDSTKAWHEGLGQFARVRTIVSALVAESGVGALLFLKAHPAYGYAMIAVIVATGIGLFAFRRALITSVEAGARFHEFCHYVRDESGLILQATSPAEESKYREQYQQFHGKAAEKVAAYFRAVTHRTNICCAIRLADTSNGKQEYVTVGRSSCMDPHRQEMTEPMSHDEGIGEVIRRKGKKGVCFIRDISGAIESGWWKESKSDKLPDIKTLMIVPINGYEKGKKCMLGILYVGSPDDVFRMTHAEPLKAIADSLGTVYPLITGRLGRLS